VYKDKQCATNMSLLSQNNKHQITIRKDNWTSLTYISNLHNLMIFSEILTMSLCQLNSNSCFHPSPKQFQDNFIFLEYVEIDSNAFVRKIRKMGRERIFFINN